MLKNQLPACRFAFLCSKFCAKRRAGSFFKTIAASASSKGKIRTKSWAKSFLGVPIVLLERVLRWQERGTRLIMLQLWYAPLFVNFIRL